MRNPTHLAQLLPQELEGKVIRFHCFFIKLQYRLGDLPDGPSTIAIVNANQTPVWRDGGVAGLKTISVKGAQTVAVKGEKQGQGGKRITAHMTVLKWTTPSGEVRHETLPPWVVLEGAAGDAEQRGQGPGQGLLKTLRAPKSPGGADMILRINPEA